MPRVTIAVPTYNGGATLARTLDQLVNQSYTNVEIIVCDNASSDDTRSIVEDYRFRFEEVCSVRQLRHVPAGRNFALGLERAEGAYFMWASDHDRWNAEYVAESVTALETRPDAVLAMPTAMYVDVDGRHIEDIPSFPDVLDADPRVRVMAIVEHLGDGYPIYGLFRTEPLRRVVGSGRRYPLGFDTSVMSDVAALGTFVSAPAAELGMTVMPDHGDMAARARKLGMKPRGSRLRSEARVLRFSLERGVRAGRLVGDLRTAIDVAATTERRHRSLVHEF